jgi:hypothetical protein
MTEATATMAEPKAAPRTLGTAAAIVAGWVAFALLDAVVFAFAHRAEHANVGPATRALLYGYSVGQSLAPGMLAAGVAALLALWRGRPRYLGWALGAAAAAPLGWVLLREDLELVASRFSGGSESRVVLFLVCTAVALAVPAAALAARLLARGRWRALPLAGGAALTGANYAWLQGDYPGAHVLAGTVAAVTASFALVGLPWAPRRSTAVGAVSAAVALAATTSFVPPPRGLGVYLVHTWSAGMQSLLPRTVLAGRGGAGGWRGAFRPVQGGAPVPPTRDPVVPANAIVIVYSVDSVRADLLGDAHADRFPHFHELKAQSTWFSAARSPGTQTAVTLSAVMMGTYYSQQFWTRCYVPEGRGVRVLFPCRDDSIRFPELLAAAGIPTVQYGQAIWLLNEYGMVRGFSEEKFVAPHKDGPSTKGKWSTGDQVMELIEARLRRHGAGPLFLFFHDCDPHDPFDLGKVKEGPKWDRYLSEVQLADERLGRLRRILSETGLAERTVLVLTADHGESFGEHGNYFHGQNLYEEQLRVPLVIHVPGGSPRRVDDPVSLIDLGATVLDLMRQPTPSHFMGQSLVPYLQGRTPKLTRPIVAEGRLKQSMVLPDGRKLIRDQREGTFEIYDLGADPKEAKNLYGEMGAEGVALMNELAGFFEEYKIRRPGYEIPYRR